MYYLFHSFAKQFGNEDWQGYGSYIHRWAKRYGIVNKAICGTKESATSSDELEEWKQNVLFPAMDGYAAKDIYNGDETALFYKSLPHRTYCFEGDKPAGSAKRKDRLTLLIITNMDGSDHRKLSVIGKAKNPRCLQKKYKMQVKDMAVDWYASKNAWMTGDIHDRIMTKFNNQMRAAGRHVLYVCDNASSHGKGEYSNIKVLRLPPNATSIIQPLDQGIILSVKRRYKKKLAERYLVSVENNKDANAVLKQLDIVAATNMVHHSWKETSDTIIQNCFRKAGFKHRDLHPATVPEEAPVAPAPDVWNKVQRWMGGLQFDEFVASEPEASTTQPMTDEEIVDLVRTENDAPQHESDDEDEEEEEPPAKYIKNTNEFLAIIDQQKAFLRRNNLPLDAVEQLETLIVGKQISLCNKQREVTDYFKSSSQTPKRKEVFKSVADVSHDLTLVDSLDDTPLEMDTLDSINTTIASSAMNALLDNIITPGRTSTPIRKKPIQTPGNSWGTTPTLKRKNPEPSTSQPGPKKKLKMTAAAAREKLINMRDSDVSSLSTEGSDTQSLIFSQE